jgi:hypothetical protein
VPVQELIGLGCLQPVLVLRELAVLELVVATVSAGQRLVELLVLASEAQRIVEVAVLGWLVLVLEQLVAAVARPVERQALLLVLLRQLELSETLVLV